MKQKLSEEEEGLEDQRQTHLAVVRSPVSSLAPAEAPRVIVMGFPPAAAEQPRPKAQSTLPLNQG